MSQAVILLESGFDFLTRVYDSRCNGAQNCIEAELIEGDGYESRRTSKDELFVLVYGMSRDREGAQSMASSE